MYGKLVLRIAAIIASGVVFILAAPWLFFVGGGLIAEALPLIADEFYAKYAGGMICLVLPVVAVYCLLGFAKMRSRCHVG